MATNNQCFPCNQSSKKTKSSIICTGCKKRFCKPHHEEHRTFIEKDFGRLIEEHNSLRQDLLNENDDPNSIKSKLLRRVDNWGKEMIKNVKETVAAARSSIIEMITKEKDQLKHTFTSLANELQANQSSTEYVETDVQEWQTQLNECRQKLVQLQMSNTDPIDIDIKSIDWKNIINIYRRKTIQKRIRCPFGDQFLQRNENQRCCARCGEYFSESSGYTYSYCTSMCSDNDAGPFYSKCAGCRKFFFQSSGYDRNYCSRKCRDNDSGCFHGTCTVLLSNGSTKFVRDICKGDVLRTPDGSEAAVTFVVKIACTSNKTSMVCLDDGLCITPWHPIRVNGNWIFPCDIQCSSQIECREVYNFALDKDHIIIVNGIECVTLGHNFKGKVIEHPYYGTTKVLDDLRALDARNNGIIELLPNSIIRDDESGLVSGIRKRSKSSL